MANEQRGFVEVELDKTRHFRFTMNALEEIEERLGFAMSDMEEITKERNLRIKEVKVIMWAGLIHEDKELTLDEIGDMIDIGNMQYVQERLGKAFEMAQSKN